MKSTLQQQQKQKSLSAADATGAADWTERAIAEALTILVADARSAWHARFPAAEWERMAFDADRWIYQRTGHQRQGTILFTMPNHDRSAAAAPLPSALSLALKSYLAINDIHPSVGSTCVDGVRNLWDYMREVHGWKEFDWWALRARHLEDFGAFMSHQVGRGGGGSSAGAPLAASTRAIREVELNAFLRWLSQYGIVSETCQVTRSATQPVAFGRRRVDDADERRSRFPDRRAVESLAELYTTTTDAWDRLMLALCGIMLITGLRESEVRDLPLECLEVQNAGTDSERVRFIYWNRKPAGSTYYYAHRWLSPMAADLAKSLVAEVIRLTQATRVLAKRLEDADGRYVLDLPLDRLCVTTAEASRYLGFAHAHSFKASRQSYEKVGSSNPNRNLTSVEWEGPRPPGRASGRGYRRADIEDALAARQRAHPLIAYTAPDGTKQVLSQTLFCVPDDIRHLARPIAARKLGRQHIAGFLQGKRSIFARRFTEPTRKALGMRPHGFRHWLNTLANKAGMSVFLITVWMQRRNENHTYAYLWEAPDLADIARHDILDQRLIGPLADRVAALPATEREEFLSTELQVAHVGPGGLVCAKDVLSEDCGRYQACPGCGSLLAEKANVAQKGYLDERARLSTEMIEWYAEIEQQGIQVVARQYELAEETREAATALAIRIGSDHAA